MDVKKIFFPLVRNDEVENHIYGGLLIAKKFGAHIDFLSSQIDLELLSNLDMTISRSNMFESLKGAFATELNDQKNKNYQIFEKICGELDISIGDIAGTASAKFETQNGIRSRLYEYEAKFCDLVVAATPLKGEATSTFDATVINSGKNAIIIPNSMKKFNMDNILIGWNGTTSISRSLTNSINILKQAKNIHIIVTKKYDDTALDIKSRLFNYLKYHDIKATFEIVTTTNIPGEALLENTLKGNFDMVIASSYGEHGVKEIFLGGSTKYFLENTPVPVFM
ncbi:MULTISPECIES: universal stress protein [Campylobacter]|uniref:Universal stress protein n=1 Tax=Campylobacter lanienae TaxID=75658 RepID=A0ABY3G8J0_9BACT|nr:MULTISPECIES: universal stress protein [Campylobacter]TWO17386.1 universal stress protein [Campylobacter lanienae]TWO29252.1 universal stress protein [Campylobacter lanienae]